MLLTLSLLIAIIVFFAILRKEVSSDRDDYYLYSKKLGIPLLTLTIIATQVGGGMVVGVSDASYEKGFYGLLYPLGSLVGLLIIAFVFGDVLKSANLPTISAVFEEKYGFPLARKFSSVVSSVSLFSIMVAQGIAIRHLLFTVGMKNDFIFVLIWCAVILYTSLGGIKAVVKTNVLQILFIIFALLLLFLTALSNTDITSVNFAFSQAYDYSVIGWFIWPCCYMLIEQDMAQLFFSAKSKKVVKYSAIIASISIFLITIIPVTIGIFAKSHTTVLDNGILLFFAANYLDSPMYIMTAIAIILAITSTVDSLLCAISSNISYDFVSMKLSRRSLSMEIVVTTIIGTTSLAAVFYFESIINVIMFSYSFCVSTLFVPSVFGFLLSKERLKKMSVILSTLFGALSLIVLLLLNSEFTYLSILCSGLGYALPMLPKHKYRFN